MELVDRLTEVDRQPMFAGLTKLVKSRARIAISRFGQLVKCPKKRRNV